MCAFDCLSSSVRACMSARGRGVKVGKFGVTKVRLSSFCYFDGAQGGVRHVNTAALFHAYHVCSS